MVATNAIKSVGAKKLSDFLCYHVPELEEICAKSDDNLDKTIYNAIESNVNPVLVCKSFNLCNDQALAQSYIDQLKSPSQIQCEYCQQVGIIVK